MPRIIILGGGFAGTYTARRLEQLFKHDSDVQVTLISRTNYLTFTPLLPEVAGNSIGERHAVTPLRSFLRHSRFLIGEVSAVDLKEQTVSLSLPDGRKNVEHYDYLVLALGSVTNFHHVDNAMEFSFDLKSLDDAVRLRNHVLVMLEQADASDDPALRREMLTFVAGGGGYAGVEGLGQLIDFIEKALPYYPTLKRSDIRFMLASHGERLLDQIDKRLGRYVVAALEKRGVEVRLGVSVDKVTDRNAVLEPGGSVPTRTVIWAAGISVNPLLATLDLETTKNGAVVVDPCLHVPSYKNVFALGDCAAVPRGDGTLYAPTAQNATREGKIAAENIAATINGRPMKKFKFNPIGSLASLGHFQAVAQIGGLPLSGLPAWFAWRTVYLAKLPSFNRKVRVAVDWALDLVLPTDIVQMPIGTSDDFERVSKVAPRAETVPAPITAADEEPSHELEPAKKVAPPDQVPVA